jgi:hypothetical protein
VSSSFLAPEAPRPTPFPCRLDQLESDVDKTTVGIREETRHAEAITVTGQTFYMCVGPRASEEPYPQTHR